MALLQRGTAEFIGTFTLIFVGAGSIIATGGHNLTAIGLAHGLVIAVMASAVGHISGGHFNPAVTLGFFVTRRIEPKLARPTGSRSSSRPCWQPLR
jgi:glycerol uptake facilitator-like aquaporin